MDTRASVRRAAIRVLLGAEGSGRFVDDVLAEDIGAFEPRDRRLLQEITFGATRHRNTLDRLFEPYLKLPVDRQRAAVRWGLRVGGYQLVYLARVPAHAAVHQTLEGLKGLSDVSKRDVGFANALLRRLLDDIRFKRAEPPAEPDDPTALPVRRGFCHFRRPVLPLRNVEPVDHLAVKHSHPEWLVRRWLERFGEEEAEEILDAGNRTPRTTARVTRRAPSRAEVIESLQAEGFEAQEGPIEGSIALTRGGDLAASETLRKGWCQVQDVTAMELGRMMQPPAGTRALDLCAAPGGKAGQLLDAVGEDGEVIAADRSAERLARVEQNLSRLGGPFRIVELPDNPDAIDLGESFRYIVVDAPCTNTGVLARRPDARWRVRRSDIDALADLQSRLLEAAFRHLAPRGRLLYCTCSIESEENEDRVAALHRAHPDLTELEVRLFLPHRAHGDGGFGSLLRREA